MSAEQVSLPPQNLFEFNRPASNRERGPALLSVVVPCFNEETVVRETHRRLVAALEAVPALDFEIVYVDDGSQDATLNLLRGLQRADARVRVLALSRNFGHQPAVTAGLQHVAGQVVVLIDADLQDPPEVIAEMLDRWRAGADVAYGLRTERDGETRFKRWTAGAFPHGFVVTAASLAGAGIVAILALPLLVSGRFRERLPGRRFLAGRRWAEAVSRHGAHLAEALRLVRAPRRMLALLGLSAAAWACEGAVFATVAAATRAGAEPMGPWFSLAAGTLATTIPSAPGYVGTFDWFAAQGLEAYGVPPQRAAAFALTVHAVLWAPLTAVGLFYLLARGIRPRRVRGGIPPGARRTSATTTVQAGTARESRCER